MVLSYCFVFLCTSHNCKILLWPFNKSRNIVQLIKMLQSSLASWDILSKHSRDRNLKSDKISIMVTHFNINILYEITNTIKSLKSDLIEEQMMEQWFWAWAVIMIKATVAGFYFKTEFGLDTKHIQQCVAIGSKDVKIRQLVANDGPY